MERSWKHNKYNIKISPSVPSWGHWGEILELLSYKGITRPCSTAYWAQFMERIHIKVPQNTTIQKP